jgi:DNA polymerase IV
MNSFLPVSSYKVVAGQDGAKFPHFMLVDMNSFFATVEQQANPFFRDRPLGVVASLHRTSCLIAASKEAKKLGIKTGTLIWKAQQICPDIVLVESEPQKYREVNRRVNRILEDYSDRIEQYSIDESFLDFSDSKINPLEAGTQIKRRIREEVGEVLTCSVGIGQNKFLSKLAADLNKPDGLTILWRDQLPQIYEKLKMSDLWGVARGWERRLARMGLVSPGDVLRYPLANMIAAFGKPGYYIWHRINGLEQDEIASDDDPPKSFGHSWVLNFRTTDKSRLAPVVLRLAEKAARRMRRDGFKARGFYLAVATADGQYFHQSRRLDYQIETGYELYEAAMIMWRDWRLAADATQVAVGFSRLTERHEQLPLFGKSSRELNDSLDLINDKYGEFTVRSGMLVHTKNYAPDAIAFGL